MTDTLISQAIADAVRAMTQHENRDSTLQEIVEQAVGTIGGFQHAGVTLVRRGGAVDTLAATDGIVRAADEAQYELSEGPCLDAIWVEDLYIITDTTIETRWPRWSPRAAALGIRGVLSARIATPGHLYGALNLYSLEPADTAGYDVETVQVAHLFADSAALALNVATKLEGLSSALQTRHHIGMAQGILMQRYNIDADTAFAVMRRHSQQTNTKLHRVAADIIAQRVKL